MKGFLNNPKFVLVLAAGAFAVAGTNIFLPLLSDGSFNDEEFVPAHGLESPETTIDVAYSSSNQPAGERVASIPRDTAEIPHIGWVTAPNRDPFRFRGPEPLGEGQLEISLENAALPAAPNKSANESKQVSVNAVVIAPAFKLAVVDGQLLKQGDEILDGRMKVLNASTIEYENNAGLRKVFPVEQLNLEPGVQ